MCVRKFALSIATIMLSVVANAENVAIPSSLDFGMDQHSSFTVNELQSSPLLKGLFNLSVEELGNGLAKVCIEPQHNCKMVRNNDVVNVVSSNGVVKFDK